MVNFGATDNFGNSELGPNRGPGEQGSRPEGTMEEDQEHPGEMPGSGKLEGQRRRATKSPRSAKSPRSFGSKAGARSGSVSDTQSTGAVTPPGDGSEPETPLSDDDYSGTPESTPLGSAAASPTIRAQGSAPIAGGDPVMLSSRPEREHIHIGDSPMTPFHAGEDMLSVKAELDALRDLLSIKDDELQETLRLNDTMVQDMQTMEEELVATRGELAAEREKTGRWEGILASARDATIKSVSYRASVEQYALLQSRVQVTFPLLQRNHPASPSPDLAQRPSLDLSPSHAFPPHRKEHSGPADQLYVESAVLGGY